jgi:hypothetical protein
MAGTRTLVEDTTVSENIEKSVTITARIRPDQEYEWDVFVELLKETLVRHVTLNAQLG